MTGFKTKKNQYKIFYSVNTLIKNNRSYGAHGVFFVDLINILNKMIQSWQI